MPGGFEIGKSINSELRQPGSDDSLLKGVQDLAGQNKGAALVGDIVGNQIVLFAADKADAKLDGVEKPANAWERQQLAAIALYEAVAASHGSAAADKMMNSLRGHLLKADTFVTADLLGVAVNLAEQAKQGKTLGAYSPGGVPAYAPPPVLQSQPQPPSAFGMLSQEQLDKLNKAHEASEESASKNKEAPVDGDHQKPGPENRSGPSLAELASYADPPLDDLSNAGTGIDDSLERVDANNDNDDEDDLVLQADPRQNETPLPPSFDEMNDADLEFTEALLQNVSGDAQDAIDERSNSQRLAAQHNPLIQPQEPLDEESNVPKAKSPVEAGSLQKPAAQSTRNPIKILYRRMTRKAGAAVQGANDLQKLQQEAAQKARDSKRAHLAKRKEMHRKRMAAQKKGRSDSAPERRRDLNTKHADRILSRSAKHFDRWVRKAAGTDRNLTELQKAQAMAAVKQQFADYNGRTVSLHGPSLENFIVAALKVHFAQGSDGAGSV